MDEVFGKCMICGKQTDDAVDGYDNDTGDLLGVCYSCRADAALGRAVRRMPRGTLIHYEPFNGAEWRLKSLAGEYNGDTPEAALKAAGLMEVKG